jgi:hypothetical protein
VDDTVQVRRCLRLHMHADDVRACLGEVRHTLVWLDNHLHDVVDRCLSTSTLLLSEPFGCPLHLVGYHCRQQDNSQRSIAVVAA